MGGSAHRAGLTWPDAAVLVQRGPARHVERDLDKRIDYDPGAGAVLRCPNAGRFSCGGEVLYLDGERKFGEGRWKSVPRIDVHAEFVVALAEVLDEGVGGFKGSGHHMR